MKIYFLIAAFFITVTVQSQNGIGSWNTLNINVKIHKKWSIFAEGQVRSLLFYNNFHYYEVKGGGVFKLTKNFSLTSGIGSYNTYGENGNFQIPMQNKEIRTWLQINIKQPIGRVLFENRYRMEQRFTSNGYRNRYRIRVGATIPINEPVIKPKTIYAIGWNELFFTNNEPFFERNRSFMGVGYELNESLAMQIGYIYQFDYKINDETGRDFFNLSFLYNFDLTKSKTSKNIPSEVD